MAHTFNDSNLTLSAKEAAELSKFIVEKSFALPALEKIHAVHQGITMKEQIAFVGKLGRVGVKQSGCTPATSGAGSAFSEKFWEPEKFGDRFINCVPEMNALFKAYFDKIKSAQELYDMQGSDLAQLLAVLLDEAIAEAIMRIAWFGDKNVAAAGASTAGIVSAADIKLYNVIDGLWKQIFTGVTASTIVKADLKATAEESLQAVYDASDSRLRNTPGAMFLVSRNIFDKYKKELKAASKSFTIDVVMDGLPSLKWDGFEVVNMETIWDKELQYFVENTTTNGKYLPDRIVFTTKENIPVGTLNSTDLSKLDSWYDKKDKSNYTDFEFTIDAKQLEDYMITVAYGEMPEPSQQD